PSPRSGIPLGRTADTHRSCVPSVPVQRSVSSCLATSYSSGNSSFLLHSYSRKSISPFTYCLSYSVRTISLSSSSAISLHSPQPVARGLDQTEVLPRFQRPCHYLFSEHVPLVVFVCQALILLERRKVLVHHEGEHVPALACSLGLDYLPAMLALDP